jgi:hypothetical protein
MRHKVESAIVSAELPRGGNFFRALSLKKCRMELGWISAACGLACRVDLGGCPLRPAKRHVWKAAAPGRDFNAAYATSRLTRKGQI